MSTTTWHRCPSRTGSKGRIFERVLGPSELGFYWDSVYSGTADCTQNATIYTDSAVMDRDNITAAWICLKRQFPLLGAQLREVTTSDVRFVVDEDRLGSCGAGELAFSSLSSAREVEALVDRIVNGNRVLSNDLLACIFVLNRRELPNQYHVMIHAAHCITDGIANASILRTFLDLLCTTIAPVVPPLEQRLALAVSSEDLMPCIEKSRARLRWHRVMGQVLFAIRSGKLAGGHTLPRNITTTTNLRPARSGYVSDSFSIEESERIAQNCRKSDITFGNAHPVLGQIALTRVLYKRYLDGTISSAEWEFRKKQPMMTGGPINLRPFLDRTWYSDGGAANVCLSINFFFFTLPFMPLGGATNLRPEAGLPSFQTLLSPERFLLRSKLIKRQAMALFRHPRFLDICFARLPSRVERSKGLALKWRENNGTIPGGEVIPVAEQAQFYGPVMTHGGSHFGNHDRLAPQYYPTSTPTEPKIQLLSSVTYLRCRPAELYLGASTSRQQLRLNVFWDKNVFDEDVVADWLSEVKRATLFYLGDESKVELRKQAKL